MSGGLTANREAAGIFRSGNLFDESCCHLNMARIEGALHKHDIESDCYGSVEALPSPQRRGLDAANMVTDEKVWTM